MQRIRTFHPRRGRMSVAQTDAVRRLLPVHGVPDGPIEPARLFGGRPVALEIGFGLGHATVEMARDDPSVGILAVDVHTPGVARLLLEVERLGLDNVRVMEDDAVDVLADRLAPGCLHEIRVFFPDPWPKARHHKRRLVRPDLVALMASRLEPGGLLRLATDWSHYAEDMRGVLDAEPLLRDAFPDGGARLDRPETKFERTGRSKGHEVTDLAYVRVGA